MDTDELIAAETWGEVAVDLERFWARLLDAVEGIPESEEGWDLLRIEVQAYEGRVVGAVADTKDSKRVCPAAAGVHIALLERGVHALADPDRNEPLHNSRLGELCDVCVEAVIVAFESARINDRARALAARRGLVVRLVGRSAGALTLAPAAPPYVPGVGGR
ncbi:MAG: hypothetical protein ACOYN0_05130 [Phycisphaerales bacterium]